MDKNRNQYWNLTSTWKINPNQVYSWAKIITSLQLTEFMAEGSVNVESRTSSQDKRWTIMAALLGTNTAVMLFQGIEQEANPTKVREFALTIIAATLPFQGIYFLIYTFLLENQYKLDDSMKIRLEKASALCQVVAYFSLVGVGMMWYNISNYVGIFFIISTFLAIIFIRLAMSPFRNLDSENSESLE